jgi:hypothetical protein
MKKHLEPCHLKQSLCLVERIDCMAQCCLQDLRRGKQPRALRSPCLIHSSILFVEIAEQAAQIHGGRRSVPGRLESVDVKGRSLDEFVGCLKEGVVEPARSFGDVQRSLG